MRLSAGCASDIGICGAQDKEPRKPDRKRSKCSGRADVSPARRITDGARRDCLERPLESPVATDAGGADQRGDARRQRAMSKLHCWGGNKHTDKKKKKKKKQKRAGGCTGNQEGTDPHDRLEYSDGQHQDGSPALRAESIIKRRDYDELSQALSVRSGSTPTRRMTTSTTLHPHRRSDETPMSPARSGDDGPATLIGRG